MIKHLYVEYPHSDVPLTYTFNEDLNIFTGRNGSGKTTTLKLLWYLISGNVERAIQEIEFRSVELETTAGTLRVSRTAPTPSKFEIGWESGVESSSHVLDWDAVFSREFDKLFNIKVAKANRSSVFFPTFRRVEGGFSIEQSEATGRATRFADMGAELGSAMDSLTTRLSVYEHRFVASISTRDIVELLTTQYAGVAARTNRFQTELSNYITEEIQKYSVTGQKSEGENLQEAVSLLQEIQIRVKRNSEKRETLLRPFTVLSELITSLFRDKGIEIAERLVLGTAARAISSAKLSAGEKQMLSFLSYNAFQRHGVIFIDEPELSLHPDWQRQLFPILLRQGTHNQFIVATHSPFIYAKYPDKEMMLDTDRGGE